MRQRHVFLAVIVTFAFAPAADAAGRNGQIILTQAQAPEVCTQVYQPVCGTDKDGKRVTYSNACFARAANASNVSPGECPK
jgi:hypothetical protein